jgi:hypothetical protein
VQRGLHFFFKLWGKSLTNTHTHTHTHTSSLPLSHFLFSLMTLNEWFRNLDLVAWFWGEILDRLQKSGEIKVALVKNKAMSNHNSVGGCTYHLETLTGRTASCLPYFCLPSEHCGEQYTSDSVLDLEVTYTFHLASYQLELITLTVHNYKGSRKCTPLFGKRCCK